MKYFVLFSTLLVIVTAKWKPDPPPELPTDQAIHDSHPDVIQAKKMSKLAPTQNVIMTCRYMLFKIDSMNYTQARDHCGTLEWPITKRLDGKKSAIGLATVQNQDENDDITRLLRSAYGVKFNNKRPYTFGNWVVIGLTKRIDNQRSLTKKEKGVFNKEHWFYEDRGMARYGNFRKLMPDQQKQGNKRKGFEYQNVVQINKKGFWDDTFASLKKPFACQYCGKYIVFSKHMTWTRAQAMCEDVGLTFATVESADENAELKFAAEITLGTELEERRFNNHNWIWIGEKEQMDENGEGNGVWEHWNGQPLPYKPKWDRKRQPDNWVLRRGEQSVVAFSRKDGKWDDSFMFKKRPFACMCKERGCQFDF